jgi:hypothetical protein
VVRAHPTVPNKSYSYRKLRGTVICCSYQIATTTVLVSCAVRARPNFDRMARRANAPSVRPLSVGYGWRVSKEKRCTRADIVSDLPVDRTQLARGTTRYPHRDERGDRRGVLARYSVHEGLHRVQRRAGGGPARQFALTSCRSRCMAQGEAGQAGDLHCSQQRIACG